MRPTSFLASALILIHLACAAAIAAPGPKTFKVGEFNFTRPDSQSWEWVDVSGSAMRKAQFKVSNTEKKQSAEVVFFYFGPGQGGDVQANIERWFGQFQEGREKISPKVEETTAGKTKLIYVQAEGTYLSGMPGGPRTPQPNSMLLGGILHGAEGNVFVKMTGPKELVKSSAAPFKTMVQSAAK